MQNPTTTLLKAPAAWGAVISMALTVAVLIASEFMPVSLLTPIASDLLTTEGQTGTAISISGIFAVITSLFISGVTRRVDRRVLMLSMSGLLIVSALIVTFAPTFTVLMIGRALLGVAIGGFWSMSTSIIMRLLPADLVPKGLALLNAGNAIAATISAPLGSLLGSYVGWRGAFFFVVPLAALALVWQWISLPTLPSRKDEGSGNVVLLLVRPQVALGMGAILFLFMGQFALFTYLRPFLETVTGVGISTLSLSLLLMGLAGVAGTYVVGRLLRTHLFSIVIVIPLVMAVVAVALIAFGSVPAIVLPLLVVWGFFATAAPVPWGTWLTRSLPNDAEAGGGLQVAVIQLAITIGAAAGGFLFDSSGWGSTFALSTVLLFLSSAFAIAAWRYSTGVKPAYRTAKSIRA